MARERRDGRGDGDSRDSARVDFVVKIRRSACVVKGGRRFSFNALVVVGDKQGRVNFGYGKANEVPPAVEKAIKEGEAMARRTKKLQLRGNTIPHRVIGKFGASRVILVPAGPGQEGQGPQGRGRCPAAKGPGVTLPRVRPVRGFARPVSSELQHLRGATPGKRTGYRTWQENDPIAGTATRGTRGWSITSSASAAAPAS